MTLLSVKRCGRANKGATLTINIDGPVGGHFGILGSAVEMTDRAINLGCVVAYGLWAAVVVFLGLGLILDNTHVGQVGLAASAAAATATIRSYFVKSNQIMRNALALRRDGDVRSVR